MNTKTINIFWILSKRW